MNRLVKNLWGTPKAAAELTDLLEQARQEIATAKCYYNSVSDIDLIDHAVYLLQAAEKKYTYLLKKARYE